MTDVGLSVVNFGHHMDPARVADWFRRAESAGFTVAMISDHVAVTPDVDRAYPAPFLEAFTTLGWLAAAVPRMLIGTTVAVLPYRHPLLVRAMTDTLARITEGRFVLGVGVGWAREEFAALGVSYETRGAISDDALAVLDATAKESSVSFSGAAAAFDAVNRGDSIPFSPVWVGGNGSIALERTIRYGQAWHPLDLTMAQLATGIYRLESLAAEAGKITPMVAPRVRLRPTREFVEGPNRIAGSGTWDQITDDLGEMTRLGVGTIVLDLDSPETRLEKDDATQWATLERAQAVIQSAE
jgi:alkanesulfonate monooxygenase SsuD/methylene tetrahydromethanopterin reductase-like flavin-dependent oxidoreductase (luciferase family)